MSSFLQLLFPMRRLAFSTVSLHFSLIIFRLLHLGDQALNILPSSIFVLLRFHHNTILVSYIYIFICWQLFLRDKHSHYASFCLHILLLLSFTSCWALAWLVLQVIVIFNLQGIRKSTFCLQHALKNHLIFPCQI